MGGIADIELRHSRDYNFALGSVDAVEKVRSYGVEGDALPLYGDRENFFELQD